MKKKPKISADSFIEEQIKNWEKEEISLPSKTSYSSTPETAALWNSLNTGKNQPSWWVVAEKMRDLARRLEARARFFEHGFHTHSVGALEYMIERDEARKERDEARKERDEAREKVARLQEIISQCLDCEIILSAAKEDAK